MQTKTEQLKGVSQAEEDKLFKKQLREQRQALNKRERKVKREVMADIEAAKAKTPRRDVEKVREEREDRRTGLRI